MYDDVTPEFASWFRGFCDAECCFRVNTTGGLRASITLRYDDASILYEIQSKIGGLICPESKEYMRKQGSNTSDQVRWTINGRQAIDAFNFLETLWNSWDHWLVGLVEGEASFLIEPNGGLRISLSLREDDKPILDEIQSKLGGSVHYESKEYMREQGSNARDSVYWKIGGRNAYKLIPIFEGKMRTKKALDFEIWKAAAEHSLSINEGKPSSLRRPIMLDYKRQLEEARHTGIWDKSLKHESPVSV